MVIDAIAYGMIKLNFYFTLQMFCMNVSAVNNLRVFIRVEIYWQNKLDFFKKHNVVS